jgi:hypothetical protein
LEWCPCPICLVSLPISITCSGLVSRVISIFFPPKLFSSRILDSIHCFCMVLLQQEFWCFKWYLGKNFDASGHHNFSFVN